MSDEAILSIAASEERIVITMDKDFGDLVFAGSANHCGVLLLRTEEMNGQEKSEVIKYILANHLETLAHNFCVFQNGKLRIHGPRTG